MYSHIPFGGSCGICAKDEAVAAVAAAAAAAAQPF